MIIDIQIAEKGTRPSDFTHEDMQIIEPYRGMFVIVVTNFPPIARVEHDGADLDGDIEIAKQLCLQKLSD